MNIDRWDYIRTPRLKECPHCMGPMYIYESQKRWICDDHPRCGYTYEATHAEVNAAYAHREAFRDWAKAVDERINRAMAESEDA